MKKLYFSFKQSSLIAGELKFSEGFCQAVTDNGKIVSYTEARDENDGKPKWDDAVEVAIVENLRTVRTLSGSSNRSKWQEWGVKSNDYGYPVMDLEATR